MPGTDSPSLKLTLESMAPVGTKRTFFHCPLTTRGRMKAARTAAAHPHQFGFVKKNLDQGADDAADPEGIKIIHMKLLSG